MHHSLGKNKQKLSKRQDDVSVDDYRKKGFLPEALNNYLSLLGWSPKDGSEIFTNSEFIEKFELKDIQKSGAVFDVEKLTWMNGKYISNLSPEDLLNTCTPFLIQAEMIDVNDENFTNKLSGQPLNKEIVQKMLLTEQPRLKLISEISEKVRFFLVDDLKYDKEILVWKKGELKDVPVILRLVEVKFRNIDEWTNENIQKALNEIVEESGRGVGDVFWPVRVAISGQKSSPGPQEIGAVLGKEATIKRIGEAIKKSEK